MHYVRISAVLALHLSKHRDILGAWPALKEGASVGATQARFMFRTLTQYFHHHRPNALALRL